MENAGLVPKAFCMKSKALEVGNSLGNSFAKEGKDHTTLRLSTDCDVEEDLISNQRSLGKGSHAERAEKNNRGESHDDK